MKKYRLLFLAVILLLAVFFRLYQITTVPPGLYSDEAMNGNNALEASYTGNYKIFYPENNGREGLFINIQALSTKVFGHEPWALRVVSALFGILTVLGLYFLTKELIGRESVALFASFFLATSFWHVNFSRIGFRAIMAPAFLVLSLWLLLKAFNYIKINFPSFSTRSNHSDTHGHEILNFKTDDRPKIKNGKISFLLIVAGFLYGLGFHSYISYRVTPVLIAAIFFLYWMSNKNKDMRKKIMSSAFYFLFFALIAILPLIVYFSTNTQDFLGRTSQISVFSSESPVFDLVKNTVFTIGMFFVAGDFNWRHNFAGSPELWWPVAIFFLMGIVVGIKKIFSKQENYWTETTPSWFLLIWFAISLAPVVISNEGIPHALRAIIVIPPTMIFAALGLNWFIKKIKRWLDTKEVVFPEYGKQLSRIKKELLFLFFILFVAIAITTFTQYFIKWANNPKVAASFNHDLMITANYLNTLPKETKKYVIMEEVDNFDYRGSPMAAQPLMFITKTFLPEWQKENNLFYLGKKEARNLIKDVDSKSIWIK